VLVPPGVVQEDQQGSFVYVADESDTAKRINIKSSYQSRHYLIVSEGLSGGERVLTSGFAKLRPDIKLALTDVTDTKGVRAVFREQGMLPPEE
jgi:multidrug efflux system membrane fusion protein